MCAIVEKVDLSVVTQEYDLASCEQPHECVLQESGFPWRTDGPVSCRTR